MVDIKKHQTYFLYVSVITFKGLVKAVLEFVIYPPQWCLDLI